MVKNIFEKKYLDNKHPINYEVHFHQYNKYGKWEGNLQREKKSSPYSRTL
jgi:hypothetical protein